MEKSGKTSRSTVAPEILAAAQCMAPRGPQAKLRKLQNLNVRKTLKPTNKNQKVVRIFKTSRHTPRRPPASLAVWHATPPCEGPVRMRSACIEAEDYFPFRGISYGPIPPHLNKMFSGGGGGGFQNLSAGFLFCLLSCEATAPRGSAAYCF